MPTVGGTKLMWLTTRSTTTQKSLHQPVPWFSAVPQGLFVFIGLCEFLGGVGLILPAMTGVKPKLTSFAAVGLTLIMILAALFHIVRGEYNFVCLSMWFWEASPRSSPMDGRMLGLLLRRRSTPFAH